jgi:hypothetical protein
MRLCIGLFPIELTAWMRGTIPSFAGIAPNTALHVILAAAFLWYAQQVRPAPLT